MRRTRQETIAAAKAKRIARTEATRAVSRLTNREAIVPEMTVEQMKARDERVAQRRAMREQDS